MNDYIAAIILGIIEGLTEFLPISSTGHMILAQHLLGVSGPAWDTFKIMIQLGAVLALVTIYFQRLWTVFITLPTNPASRHFALLLLVAITPALVLGALFGGAIKDYLFNPFVVGITLILGGLIILAVEAMHKVARYHAVEELTLRTALLVGLAQTVAMIPGTSRSGATIIGGLLAGLDRRTAAEFSFFLAIPTMFAAFMHEAIKHGDSMNFDEIGLIAVGFVTSFISAWLIVKPFLDFVSRVGFAPFAYYRVALGTLVLTLMYF